MSTEHRPGFFQDEHGNWHKDRRSGADRREGKPGATHEQRSLFRRQADRELYERDHKPMIKEALDDFAEEHGGHL